MELGEGGRALRWNPVIGPDPNVKEGHSFRKGSRTWKLHRGEGIEGRIKGETHLV